jgi:hypothetical protein
LGGRRSGGYLDVRERGERKGRGGWNLPFTEWHSWIGERDFQNFGTGWEYYIFGKTKRKDHESTH